MNIHIWQYYNFICTIFAQSDGAATIYFITQFCVASIRERLLIEKVFIKLSVIGKIFRKCKDFEKSQFYRFNKAVPTRHLQSISLFSSSNDSTR